jgi:6-phosphofructokinase 1
MVRSAVALERRGVVSVVQVPKSIDNDLWLPTPLVTLGYETARHVGVGIVKSLMEDAKTTGRWYLGVTMGRPTGHLTLGIGKAVSATCTIIPEEFPETPISLSGIADIVEGSIIKRRAMGKSHGVVLLSEALVERFSPREVAELQDVDRDAQGNIRVTEIDLGRKVKNEVQVRLEQRGIKVTVVDKTIGYELRCAPPIPFDAEYARDLGYAAVTYLLEGGSGALVTTRGGDSAPIPLADVVDANGAGRRRPVDVTTESYQVAREYMVRLGPRDFTDAVWVSTLAKAAGLEEAAFRLKFGRFASVSQGAF